MARKPLDEIGYEFETIRQIPGVNNYHFYSVGSYNESPAGMHNFLDHVGETHLKSISYEQFFLTPEDILKHMVQANKRTSITLSPESHDPIVAKLSGRGVYTNDEMEAWIERALEIGIHHIDVWYFIGMPEQSPDSVIRDRRLLRPSPAQVQGQERQSDDLPDDPVPRSGLDLLRVSRGARLPRLLPHRRGASPGHGDARRSSTGSTTRPNWLSRQQLVDVGFKAVRRLMEIKGSHFALPQFCVHDYNAKIDDALQFMPVVHEADCIADPRERARALDSLGDEILKRNDMILFGGVMNQAFPLNRGIGGRWFDEMGWDPDILKEAAVVAFPDINGNQPVNQSIKQSVREYILKTFLPGEDSSELTDDLPLISGGILDSIATLKLIMHIEETFDVALEAHEADREHFDTVNQITDLIVSKKK